MREWIVLQLGQLWRPFAALAVLQIVAMQFDQGGANVLDWHQGRQILWRFAYMATGMGIAVMQLHVLLDARRRTWFLQLPLSPGQRLLSLLLVPLLLVTILLALPYLLVLGLQAHRAGLHLEWRHALIPVLLLLPALMAWSLACAILLHQRMILGGAAVIALSHVASVPFSAQQGLVLDLVFTLCFLGLALSECRPASAPRTRSAPARLLQIGMSLPAAVLATLLVWDICLPAAWRQTASLPADIGKASLLHPVLPGDQEWAQRISAFMQVSDARAYMHDDFSTAHFGSLVDTGSFSDTSRNVRWTFDHDAKRFYGTQQGSGVAQGWLGPDGKAAAQAFEAPPVVLQKNLGAPILLNRHSALWFDHQARDLRPLLRLAADESIKSYEVFGRNRLALWTSTRLIVWEIGATPSIQFSYTLPRLAAPITQVQVFTAADRFMLQLVAEQEAADGQRTRLLRLDTGEHHIAYRELHARPSRAGLSHAVIAPLPMIAYEHSLAALRYLPPPSWPKPDMANIIAALALALLGAAISFVYLRGAWRRRLGWSALALVCGLPGMLCVLLLADRDV